MVRRPWILECPWILTGLCCKEVMRSHGWTGAIPPFGRARCLLSLVSMTLTFSLESHSLLPWRLLSQHAAELLHILHSGVTAFRNPLLPEAHLSVYHFLLLLLCYRPQRWSSTNRPRFQIRSRTEGLLLCCPLNPFNTLTPIPEVWPRQGRSDHIFPSLFSLLLPPFFPQPTRAEKGGLPTSKSSSFFNLSFKDGRHVLFTLQKKLSFEFARGSSWYGNYRQFRSLENQEQT